MAWDFTIGNSCNNSFSVQNVTHRRKRLLKLQPVDNMMTDIVEIRIERSDDFSLTFAASQGSEFIDTELICTGVCTYSSDREGEVFVTDIHGIYCLKTLVRHLLTRAREECQSEH